MSITRLCDCCGLPMTQPDFERRYSVTRSDGRRIGTVRITIKSASNEQDICLDCVVAAINSTRPAPNHTPAAHTASEAGG